MRISYALKTAKSTAHTHTHARGEWYETILNGKLLLRSADAGAVCFIWKIECDWCARRAASHASFAIYVEMFVNNCNAKIGTQKKADRKFVAFAIFYLRLYL